MPLAVTRCCPPRARRRWVATGQQKNTGDREVPYVCVWDVDHCMQLQRLDHDRNERGVIALCFSGDIVDGRGGELLLTVGAGGVGAGGDRWEGCWVGAASGGRALRDGVTRALVHGVLWDDD